MPVPSLSSHNAVFTGLINLWKCVQVWFSVVFHKLNFNWQAVLRYIHRVKVNHFGNLIMHQYSRLHVKRPPYKKEFQTSEAYNSKTKRSPTKMTSLKHFENYFFLRIDKFAIIKCVKEDHYNTAGLCKNMTKWVFIRGIYCIRNTRATTVIGI